MNTQTEAMLLQRIELLTNAVHTLAATMGQRLTRAQLCERLGIHRNTLAKRLMDPNFPLPGKDGKWMLADILEWERKQ